MPDPTRRALLAATAAAPAATAATRPFAALRVGANLERWYPIARDGHARRLGRGWWRDFRAAGFDHARMFLPDLSAGPPPLDIADLYLQATEDAAAAGVTVLLGLSDMLYADRLWTEAHWRTLAALAGHVATRSDPARVALAGLNEPALPDTATWLPLRDRMLALLRGAAPRHALLWGGREWCSGRSLLETPPPADPDTLAEVHDYGGGDAASVRTRFAAIAAWRDRHGIPVLVTEMNGPGEYRQDRPGWTRELRTALPILRDLRLPVAIWSYSHGGWYRIQPDDSAQPHPEVRDLLRG